MAINFTLVKKQDDQILTVQQETSYTLVYVSDGSNSNQGNGTLTSGQSLTLNTPMDGEYRLTLSATGETDVIKTFFVIRYLQDSILTDMLTILCECNNDAFSRGNCKTRSENEAIAVRNLFSKVFSFQFNYVQRYGDNFPNVFTSFITNASNLVSCNFQAIVNNLLNEECVTGCINDTSKLNRLYLALYWAAMYFTERTLINVNDTEDFNHFQNKFNYDRIVACICNLCFTIIELENLYTLNPMSEQVYSFQFPETTSNISNIADVDTDFLSTNGELQNEANLILGTTVSFTNIGRIGFVFNTSPSTVIRIFNNLNVDITETTFETAYDNVNQRLFFVSENVFPPNSIFFRITKS